MMRPVARKHEMLMAAAMGWAIRRRAGASERVRKDELVGGGDI